MKIESHDISYVAAHEFSYEKTDTFQEELTNLSIDEPMSREEVKTQSESDLVKHIKFALFQKLLQSLSGKKEETLVPQKNCLDESTRIKNLPHNLTMRTVEVEYESTYTESESLSMQTQGVIKTEDGRSIEIDLNFNMQRSFYSKTTIKESVFIDPLVVNLDGDLPSFTNNETFSFDLDCDGQNDQISCLSKNNGFLALDKNENGIIDDGSELFGTQSGNGFKDLSQYDEDGNNWIDENDPIFENLRIWSDNKLIGLGEVGIGAIYLGANNSPYTYKNEDNESLGRLRQSSVVLFESGEVGTISQVDFAKHEKNNPLKDALSAVG
ncbi:hypothetical protein [Sulfurospirillum arcachonense]|uniref:hypothetical protein n=1 Tax=Sulfurospirillum arcachonense TaxID=57666 RepID=UPI000467FD18|nr:hypothetical protein [Sulfurospirillum arcachonense]